MSFKDVRFAKGWIALLATLLGLGFGGYTFVHRAMSTQVYVTNCGIIDYKPTAILKFCADGGVLISAIEWESWSAQGATGRGKYQINDCTPDCADGTLYYADVKIRLSHSKKINGKDVLTFISLRAKGGKNLPLSSSPSDAWPLELAG